MKINYFQLLFIVFSVQWRQSPELTLSIFAESDEKVYEKRTLKTLHVLKLRQQLHYPAKNCSWQFSKLFVRKLWHRKSAKQSLTMTWNTNYKFISHVLHLLRSCFYSRPSRWKQHWHWRKDLLSYKGQKSTHFSLTLSFNLTNTKWSRCRNKCAIACPFFTWKCIMIDVSKLWVTWWLEVHFWLNVTVRNAQPQMTFVETWQIKATFMFIVPRCFHVCRSFVVRCVKVSAYCCIPVIIQLQTEVFIAVPDA